MTCKLPPLALPEPIVLQPDLIHLILLLLEIGGSGEIVNQLVDSSVRTFLFSFELALPLLFLLVEAYETGFKLPNVDGVPVDHLLD